MSRVLPQLSEKECVFALGSAVLLVLVLFSASVRHSILCESGVYEGNFAEVTLDRQNFEARLLNVEQEGMENQMLITALLESLEERYAAHVDDGFGAMYGDAKVLSVAIDAAFLSELGEVHDDIPHGGDDDDRALRGEKTDDGAVYGQQPREEESGYDDDPNNQRRDDETQGDDGKDVITGNCAELRQQYSIIPQVSWGDAPPSVQNKWRSLDCDYASEHQNDRR